jgi:hypothetical protein
LGDEAVKSIPTQKALNDLKARVNSLSFEDDQQMLQVLSKAFRKADSTPRDWLSLIKTVGIAIATIAIAVANFLSLG